MTNIEEPPETPAPLFAIRAFKTAIFGTPHSDQCDVRRNTQPIEQKRDVSKIQPAEKGEGSQAHDAVNGHVNKPVEVPKVDLLVSPTKGILLTPGTGATRRKTVSFGTLIADAQKKEEQSPSAKANQGSALGGRRNPVPEAGSRVQPRHSSLTKTLIELSKQKTDNHVVSSTSLEQELTKESTSSTGAQTEDTDQIADTTMDLSQPSSRSGQHWKAEYEQYHKRSNREMKKMIMYGQNVKSYAVKKDYEATGLAEKLKKELAKVAAMERKVSKLAAQLKIAHAQGPEGESEQTRLVSELAQQTALAIRYKQKADNYKIAMQKRNRDDGSDDSKIDYQVVEEADEWSRREADASRFAARSTEKDTLHTELEILRTSAKKAEAHAANLEVENDALKRSLARVKEEMMSYDSRRQAREERFQKRETKSKADHKACEAQLAKLTVEHQNLLLASGQPSKEEVPALPQSSKCYDDLKGHDGNHTSTGEALVNGNKKDREPLGQHRTPKPYVSPRKGRLQKSAVDIWTLSSPRDAVDGISPTKEEPTKLPPSSVRHDIQRTLKEIDQNLILPDRHPKTDSNPDPPNLSPTTNHAPNVPDESQSAPRSTHNPTPTTISPPRAAPVSGAVKIDPAQAMVKTTAVRRSVATLGRSSSLMSRIGSRTGSLTSARGSALPAERAAAAKARLAARSAEKRKEGRGRDGRG